jgi:lysozyme
MIDSERLEQQLIVDEGLKLRPYKCSADKLTIGVGHNLDDNGITEDVAMYMLRADLKVTITELRSNFSWFERLDSYRQEVLMNMCFNLGIARLKGFRKMIAALEIKDYKEAAVQMMDSRWARQVGVRAVRLSEMMGADYE